jgi:lipoprotein LprG
MTRRWSVVIGLALVAVTAACSSGSGEEVEAEVLDVDGVRSLAAAAMADIESVLFTIEHDGADVFIDDEGRIGFRAAEGRFAAPSSADAIVSVSALGLATEVGAVAIDGELWITNPLTGDWEEAPESLTFDPSLLFDTEVGFSRLLSDGLINASLVTPEPDAEGRYHITADVDPVRVSVLTSGLVDDVDNVDLWVDATSGRLVEVTFDVGIEAGGTSWRLLLDGYGTSVSVNKPELG